MALTLSMIVDRIRSIITLGRSVCTSISGGGGGGRWAYWPGGIFLITPRLRAVQGIVDTLLTRSLS